MFKLAGKGAVALNKSVAFLTTSHGELLHLHLEKEASKTRIQWHFRELDGGISQK